MRGFIDDVIILILSTLIVGVSQSAFMRGFIDDQRPSGILATPGWSQSAFMRGFIDDMVALN